MFITIYGINNLGKSTQAKMLVERLKEAGCEAEYLKYPVYDLKPFGELLNEYLRKGNPQNFSPREAQTLYVLDRFHYQPKLEEKLNRGVIVVAEDYVHTGIAWGIGAGVCGKYLSRINAPLRDPDLSFFFYGKRFTEATEKDHRHETNNELIESVRKAHEDLATQHSWIRVHANRPIDEIHNHLWEEVSTRLSA